MRYYFDQHKKKFADEMKECEIKSKGKRGGGVMR